MVREAFGPRWAIVPYVMPGFALAKLRGGGLRARPDGRGAGAPEPRALHLRRRRAHRLRAHDRRRRSRRALRRARARASAGRSARGAPLDRRAPSRGGARSRRCCAARSREPSGDADRPWRRMVLEHRAERRGRSRCSPRPTPRALARANPLTPDHVIRTKGPAPAPRRRSPLDDRRALRDAARGGGRRATARRTTPTSTANRGAGAHAGHQARPDAARGPACPASASSRAGRDARHDARIAADIAEHTLRAKALADAIGRYAALADGDLFDMEYWSLEQAKLGKATEPPLAGQVALVTGAAGAIGFGICREARRGGRARRASPTSTPSGSTRRVRELDPKGRGLAAGVVDGRDRRALGRGRRSPRRAASTAASTSSC